MDSGIEILQLSVRPIAISVLGPASCCVLCVHRYIMQLSLSLSISLSLLYCSLVLSVSYSVVVSSVYFLSKVEGVHNSDDEVPLLLLQSKRTPTFPLAQAAVAPYLPLNAAPSVAPPLGGFVFTLNNAFKGCLTSGT